MKKIKMKRLSHGIFIIVGMLVLFGSCNKPNDKIIFVCSEDNDLYRAIVESIGDAQRYSSAEEAIYAAAEGSGILVLADNYPAEKVVLPDEFFKTTESKNIKLYIEFPDSLPGIKTGDIQKIEWERAVISSDVFGESLEKMRILTINDCHYVDIEAESPYMVVAKVAGFDMAVYGLDSTETHPILFELPGTGILVSTTKLSQFISGRYAPKDAWKSIWEYVLNRLQPDGAFSELDWKESVRPSYPEDKMLSQDERSRAARRGVEWYYKSNLLATSLQVENGEKLIVTTDGKYGTEGIRECYSSKIYYDGSQDTREERRGDCASESAMALALRGMTDKNGVYKTTAENLQDFVYFKSRMRQGPRNDPQNVQFGFINWDNREDINDGVYYADDNARVVMGTIATAAALTTDRWNEGVMANILAHFRATSPVTGFKPRSLRTGSWNKLGWKYYRDVDDYYDFAPHYQSWIMAMYLWLYDKTGYEPLFTVAKTGITNIMKAYPHEWHWANGLQQERARMILPLAWLLRIENTPGHREWLNRMVNDLLSFQDESGAIREDLGKAGYGSYGPPKSNAEYGTNEAPLIQENGDPVADMLYTSNFAFLSLTEAAAATGDKKVKDAVDKLADFMVKIQVRSDSHPELDGAWFRAFDYDRWEYWGSNSDWGWGVWSTETGWTQGWIATMLMMQEMNTNYWDFTADSNIADCFDKYKEVMLEK